MDKDWKKRRAKAIQKMLDEGYEFGVMCNNCYWQCRHGEYDCSPDILFICPNCGVSEHYTEYFVPSKRRFKFLENKKWYPLHLESGYPNEFKEVTLDYNQLI